MPSYVWKPAAHEGACSGSPDDKPVGFCSHGAHWGEVSESWRSNYVPAPQFYNLNHACSLVNKAFGAFSEGFGCYLVGSSLHRKDFRDVDVRSIVDDAAYDRLFRNDSGYTNPFWSLLCVAISRWLSEQSGLPVDFQIQRQSHANAHHSIKTGHRRQPLGIFIDYPAPGERPTEVAKEPMAKGDGHG